MTENNQDLRAAQLQRNRELEDEMNQVFAHLDKLERGEEYLEFQDIPNLENMVEGEKFPTEDEKVILMEDETELFLGANPAVAGSAEIDLRDNLLARIKSWLEKGLDSKEEKQKLLKLIPGNGKLNLEAPLFNDDIVADTQAKALSRDDFFKDYKNLTGSALSAVATVLNMILKNAEVPLERDMVLSNLSNSVKLLSHLFFALNQARKSFIMGKYEDRIQKVLKKAESTTYLFGDNLKAVIDSSKAMEKVSKYLKPKFTPKPGNSLNRRSLLVTSEVGREIFRGNATRGYTSRYNRPKPYPTKRNYTQSQPQQNRR